MPAFRTVLPSLFACFVLLSACGGGGGGGGASGGSSSSGGSQVFTDPTVYNGAASAALASAQEGSVATPHSLSLNGHPIAYTATAGHLTASSPGGQPEASFFYVAYTADGQTAAQRPVTFFYNGGPGSATIWLHLGSFGPRRLVSADPSSNPPVPFPMVDNQESLLDVSDLVFVDAVGTGYSEAISPNVNNSFWGVDADAAVFRDFVARYVAVNQRSASPKFLFGESYGTVRASVMANVLETAGIALKGVVLQSSILNYNSNCAVFDLKKVNCAGYVPSYGEVGAYYNLDNPNPTDPVAYAQQMRTFASGTYAPAADQYIQSRTPPSASLVTQLVGLTGMVASQWENNLDLDPGTFEYRLIPGTVIGAYDARVHVAGNDNTPEPSSTVITGPFTSALRSYLPDFLHYGNSSTYIVGSEPANSNWDFSHDGMNPPDVIPDLATALTLNPKLRVLSLNGYHDLVTPFYQTELDLARLGSQPTVSAKFYGGGHMTYLDDTSRPLEKADLAAFYGAALAP